MRKLAAEIINGAETKVEVLYPSMYFAIEKHKNSDGSDIPNTAYAVNNIYLNGVRIAASLPNGECQYYLTDQVDSVSVVTNDKAEVVNRFEYLPFGESWVTEGDGKNRAKFNSQELDAETGYYYFNARFQDPEIGRFVTADNVIDGEKKDEQGRVIAVDTQGWNRYSYCKNNPIVYKDPTGHLTIYIPGTDFTSSDSPTWTDTKSNFSKKVEATFGEKPVTVPWKRGNSKEERTDAVKMLDKMISEHKFKPGEKLNIITHSHGGNIAKEYSNLKDAKKIDNLVNFGTPQRDDYKINKDKVKNYINVYSENDGVQKKGGHTGPIEVGPAGRRDPSAKNYEYSTDKNKEPVDHKHVRSEEAWDKITPLIKERK